jgi:Ni,Fe-hydrogenase I cytochrome b subunit
LDEDFKGDKKMKHELRTLSIIAWIALPTVMYGGYALLGLLTQGGLSEFQQTFFRAGHAHAGVLLLLSLLYHHYMEQTALSTRLKVGSARVLLLGVLAQSGGFFLHLAIGQAGAPSLGTTVTSIGALLLALSVLVLAYGLIITRQ